MIIIMHQTLSKMPNTFDVGIKVCLHVLSSFFIIIIIIHGNQHYMEYNLNKIYTYKYNYNTLTITKEKH